MGKTSSRCQQIQRQEHFVNDHYKKNKKTLLNNGQYSEQQVKGKLRQVYWRGNSACSNNDFVSKKNCNKSYKNMPKIYSNKI